MRDAPSGPRDNSYVDAYVDAMFVELTWNICHFSGLLNNWFTLLKLHDEMGRPADASAEWDDVYFPDFVAAYNSTVPDSIKVRNNNLLGGDGFGT
ncbi:hypothetical protein [Rhizorhapis sp. SPR117]|uniref:hypothetical protein n=1 Tax=Rhizorhapis sp. SPR117 TaxID=2912611 RepID=UPI001F3B1DBC|nr:hypothetical protein [Rhizorhapis sp. SPR117]